MQLLQRRVKFDALSLRPVKSDWTVFSAKCGQSSPGSNKSIPRLDFKTRNGKTGAGWPRNGVEVVTDLATGERSSEQPQMRLSGNISKPGILFGLSALVIVCGAILASPFLGLWITSSSDVAAGSNVWVGLGTYSRGLLRVVQRRWPMQSTGRVEVSRHE